MQFSAEAHEIGRVDLLALDIDGTILTGDKSLTARTADAIRSAARAGVHVVLVTGRPLCGLPKNVLEVPGIRYAITSNGAVTTDLEARRSLRAVGMDRSTAWGIARIAIERDLIHSVFIDGMGYCEPRFLERELLRVIGKPHEAYIRSSRTGTENIERLIGETPHAIENIWLVANDTAERDELETLIRGRWPVKTVLTGACDVEVGAPGADKGLALRDLASGLGIDKAHIMAIGDNGNDLGMLAESGLPVAMGNATEQVKLLAAFVTDSNENDGAAKAIERVLPLRTR